MAYKTSQGVPHNTVRWRMCTNRHRSTDGTAWGWIEGAPGNVCWGSSGASLSEDAAHAACMEHNKWLDDQDAPAIKVLKIRERMDPLVKKALSMRQELAAIDEEVRVMVAKIDAILATPPTTKS